MPLWNSFSELSDAASWAAFLILPKIKQLTTLKLYIFF